MNSNTFTIKQVPINIFSVTPTEVLSSYNGYTNYVKTIEVVYEFVYSDITITDPEYIPVRLKIRLKIDVPDSLFNGFINYEDLVKENFYSLAISTAQTSPEILKKVDFVRIRTGLDLATPKELPPILKPFN